MAADQCFVVACVVFLWAFTLAALGYEVAEAWAWIRERRRRREGGE